jgi:hypothetical protein
MHKDYNFLIKNQIFYTNNNTFLHDGTIESALRVCHKIQTTQLYKKYRVVVQSIHSCLDDLKIKSWSKIINSQQFLHDESLQEELSTVLAQMS